MKKIFLALVLIFLGSIAAGAQDEGPEQKITDFNLAGYGEKGKKTWEISGKSADIFADIVKLTNIVARVYGEEEDINLTADNGTFSKEKGNVHLEDNVVVTTSSGAKMTTDSLDWDREKEIVSTDAQVGITKGNLTATAEGASAQPNLKKVALEKDVKLEITPQERAKSMDLALRNKIIITCDGPMEVDYEKDVAVFYNNVKVDDLQNQIYADRMDLYFDTATKPDASTQADMMGEIDKIVAKGNVRIVHEENTSYSEEAVYDARTKKITLTGRPKLVIYSTEGFNAAP